MAHLRGGPVGRDANLMPDLRRRYDPRRREGGPARAHPLPPETMPDLWLCPDRKPSNALRRLEWRGISRVIESLRGGLAGVRWMDFGCGNGGLVRVGRQAGIDICGF